MKLENIIAEARRADVVYREEKVQGALTKVIAELKGSDSAEATKLAKKYAQLQKLEKALEAKKKDVNLTLTERTLSLFDDATDIVATRVLETASFTITVAKQSKGTPKSKVDYDKILAGIGELVDEKLRIKIEELIAAHTTSWTEDPKKPTLSVKAIDEGIIDASKNKLTQWVAALESKLVKFVKAIRGWGREYDAQLSDLKAQLPA